MLNRTDGLSVLFIISTVVCVLFCFVPAFPPVLQEGKLKKGLSPENTAPVDDGFMHWQYTPPVRHAVCPLPLTLLVSHFSLHSLFHLSFICFWYLSLSRAPIFVSVFPHPLSLSTPSFISLPVCFSVPPSLIVACLTRPSNHFVPHYSFSSDHSKAISHPRVRRLQCSVWHTCLSVFAWHLLQQSF